MRRKILYGLAIYLALLFAAGFGAMYLLEKAASDFARATEDIFLKSQSIQSIRYETSSINTHYLPSMLIATPSLPPIKDPELFENADKRMLVSIEVARGIESHASKKQLDRLQASVETYGNRYRKLFAEQPDTREARALALEEIADLSQMITSHSQSLTASLDKSFLDTTEGIRKRSNQGVWVISVVLLAGVVAAAFIFFSVESTFVSPLMNLTDSVREIQKGNFELSLPERGANDEIGRLIPAFNSMAAELRSRRRATDDKLLKIDLQNRAILAGFPYPLFLIDEDGQIMKSNPEAQELLDDTASFGTFPGKLANLVEESLSNDQELLTQRLDEALLFRRNEKEYFYLPRIFKLTTLEGVREGWVLLLLDVSRLRFFDDLKSNMISTVSHEIKTPLTGIRMVLHLLLEKKTGDLNPTQEKMLLSSFADCEKLLETLRNLLELSRMESGANSLNLAELSPIEVFDRALRTFEKVAQEKNITLARSYEGKLPPILADNVRISEVVNNFLSNAIKHSPPGGKVTLRLARKNSDFVRFSVLDEGQGVPDSSRGRIFDRFYRAPEQLQVEGVGLGLSIAREIVTAHDGRIGLTDGPNGETEFYCDIPRA